MTSCSTADGFSTGSGASPFPADVGITTSAPARRRLGFPDRRPLRSGMAADVVCFDPETVRDTATSDEPRSLPEGIPYVIVNGRPVVDGGRHTGDLPGRALRRVS